MASKEDNQQQKINNNLLKENNDLLKQRIAVSKEAVTDQRDFANVLREQTKDLTFQKQERKELLSIGTSLNKIAQEGFNIDERALGTSKDINNIGKQRVLLQGRINQLSSIQGTITDTSKQKQVEINDTIAEQIVFAQNLNKELAQQEAFGEKIANKFSVKSFQGISNLVKDIPILKTLATPFQEAADAAREVEVNQEGALERRLQQRKIDEATLKTGKGLNKSVLERLGLEKQITSTGAAAASQIKKGDLAKSIAPVKGIPNSMASLTAGLKALGPALTLALKPLAIFTLFSEIFKADKETVKLQKSMALTSGEASDLRQEFSNIANESGNINVTTTALLTTVNELSKQFGRIAIFSADTLVTTIKLTQQVGISSEAAGNLAAASVVTGENFEDQYKSALGTSYELQRQEGVQLDLKEILEESGKVTGTIRANLGTNIESIAKAVTQAKLFGTSLNNVAGASQSLLDFESSITAELEAELLLGKNINLETARQASLNGDLVTVAEELRKEAGDYNDFQNMNVIQQEALAKAVGMQKDDLANALFTQEVGLKTAKELRALGKDDLADTLEKQNAQDKFNKSVEKLKSLLGDAVTVFMPLLDGLSSAFLFIGEIVKFISPIIGTITGALTGFAIGGPIGAAIGGTLGAISDVDRGMSTADDAIIPTTGYGDTIIKSGKDTLALNNEDSVAVVAGTNLGGGSNKTGERTNQLLESLIMQNSRKPELSPVGLYEIQ